MKRFVYDMIHMTEGEKLINYWWLWLIILVIAVLLRLISNKPRPPYK